MFNGAGPGELERQGQTDITEADDSEMMFLHDGIQEFR
jgi:hypothetical protein